MPKLITASNKSPYVPTFKRSPENKIIQTRRERVITKKQQLKHDNTESSKNVEKRQKNGLSDEASLVKKCNRCEYSVRTTTMLNRHMKLVHEKMNSKQHQRKKTTNNKTRRKPSKMKFNSELKNYLCKECGLNFTSNKSLQMHRKKANANPKAFRCDQCHFSTNHFENLQAHVDGIH